MPAQGGDRVTRLLAGLATRLRNPLELRLFVSGALLAAWYFAAYSPLSGGIDEAVAARERAEKHLALARDIEGLRRQAKAIGRHLPGQTDPNEWIGYLLDGARKFRVRMNNFVPQAPRKHGPFDVVVLKMSLQGSFEDVDALLGWIEANPRLFRIDELSVGPQKGHDDGGVEVLVTVLGLMG